MTERVEATTASSTRELTRRLAVEELLTDLLPDLVRYFANRLNDRDDAADAAADTLLVLWRKHRSLPTDETDARRFAFGVARNVLSTTRRSRSRRHALTDRIRVEISEQWPEDLDRDLELRSALASLKPKERELVLLVAWDGFSVADAGKILGIQPGAARTRYSRVRTKLRAQLNAPSSPIAESDSRRSGVPLGSH